MGALGTGPFENDDAMDFLDDLQDLPAGERGHRVLQALDGVLLAQGFVDAPRMCEAVAAAAAVGASLQPQSAAGESGLPGWLAREPLFLTEEVLEKSRQVLRRAVRSREGEWWELWEEAGLVQDVDTACQRALSWLGDRDD